MIDYYRKELHKELQDINVEILKNQSEPSLYAEKPSALIQFNRPIGAHIACQSLQHPRPHVLITKHVEESACHIIWENVSTPWWERYIRKAVIEIFSTILMILCIIPVTSSGLLSQLSYTATLFTSLNWLKDLSKWFLSTLQGILSPCVLTVVTILVSMILDCLVSKQGIHTRIAAELSMQNYYFGFLFLQVFLVMSISSSTAAVLNGLSQDFKSFAALMAQNLPKASNYFLSYILPQALSVSVGSLLRISRLLKFVIAPLLDNTARQKWNRQREPEMKWGTFFPVYTNLAVIGLIYSVISPLILLLNVITFSLFLIVQRYNILNVSRFDLDTGGLVYPRAINQLFIGLYVMELYLIGLFFLVRDHRNQTACIEQGIIMVLALLCTGTYQILLNQAYQPLFMNLPAMLDNATDESTWKRPHEPNVNSGLISWLILAKNKFEGLIDVISEFSEQESLTLESRSIFTHEYTDSSNLQNVILKARQPVI